MIRFKCQCGTPYTLADQLAGRTFRCTKCEATITLPAIAAPGAAPPAYAPPPPRYAGNPTGPQWGSSAIHPSTGSSADLKVPSSDVIDVAKDDQMDAPTLDPDRDPPPKSKKKTTKQRPAETFELPDKIELMPEDAPTADPDRDDVLLERAGLEPVEEGEKKKKKKKKGVKGSASDRVGAAKRRLTGETPRVAMECPLCGETIARAARECPNCGAPLGGRRGLGAKERQILSALAAVAGGIVLLVGVVFVVKMLREDTGSGQGGGGKVAVKKTPLEYLVPQVKKLEKLPADTGETAVEDPPKKEVKPRPQETPQKPQEPPPPAVRPDSPRDEPSRGGPLAQPLPVETFPEGPHKAAVLALRDATDLASVEHAARELGGADGFADAAAAYMKAGDAALRGRITRALLAGKEGAARKAALDLAWRSDEVEVLLPAIELSAETEGQDGLLQRVESLRGRSRETMLIGEAFAKCLVSDAAPDGVAVSAARDASAKDKDLGARLSTVLLAGGEGAGLALAPDALTAGSKLIRKAALRGLETFLARKGEKDPLQDPDGARAEWIGIAGTYAPLRDELARACDDGLVRGITPEQLAAIVDARIQVIAHRKDVLPVLPIFVRDSAAKTSAAGAALAELIPRFTQGVEKESAKTLNDVIDALGEDARNAAPGIIQGCLRAGDRDCAAAAARAVDKGIVSFLDATAFPDLLEPAPPPRTTLDAVDPNALLTAALFRGDAKDVEKLAWACKKIGVAEEALARLGSHETEKRLLQACAGKEKLPQGVDPFGVLTECATRSYTQELKAFLTAGKDLDHGAYENLTRTVERSCTASDALALVKLAELGRDKADGCCTNYALAAAKAVGASDNREARAAVYQAIKALDKQPRPPSSKGGKGQPPPPAMVAGNVDVRGLVTRCLPETNADAIHDELTAALEKWLGEVRTAKSPPFAPTDEDLNRFLQTIHASSLARDQSTAKACLDVAGAVLPADRDRFAYFNYHFLDRVQGPGIEVARMEVTAANTVLTTFRGEASVVLGRAKDQGSLDALKQVVSVLLDKKRFMGADAGVLAGLALIDAKEGGLAALRVLAEEKTPLDVREGCFFALAKSGQADDLKVLGEWARKGDPDVRAHVARGIACAVRSPGGAGAAGAVLERLRIDPSPLVRAEAAVAYMEEARDAESLLEGALALDTTDRTVLDRTQGGILSSAATGDAAEVTLFFDLCRAYDHAAREHRLEARANMSRGRVREILRLARAGAHR